jgi:hypothetical protein
MNRSVLYLALFVAIVTLSGVVAAIRPLHPNARLSNEPTLTPRLLDSLSK